jgi:hypothetical protein
MKGAVVIAVVALMTGVAREVWYASQAADAEMADSRTERLSRESARDIEVYVKLSRLIRSGATELALKYLETVVHGAEITLQGVEDSISGELRTAGREAVDYLSRYRAKLPQETGNSP